MYFHEFYFWCNERNDNRNTNSTREGETEKKVYGVEKKWPINEFMHSKWTSIQFKDGNSNSSRNRIVVLNRCVYVRFFSIVLLLSPSSAKMWRRAGSRISNAQGQGHTIFFSPLCRSLMPVSSYRFPLIYIFDEFHIKTDGKGINLEVWICPSSVSPIFYFCIFHEQGICIILHTESAYFIRHLNIVALLFGRFLLQTEVRGAGGAVHRKTW